MKIESIDRSTCRLIMEEAREALKAMAERYGLVLSEDSGAKFSPETVTFKATLNVVHQATAEGGVAVPGDFSRNCWAAGMQPTDYGRKFKSWDGREYVVTGCRPRAHKRPVLARSLSDGKTYVFPLASLKG